jgi:hypothetical protein
MPLDEILKLVEVMEGETKQLKYDLYKLCWFMRGGMTITEAYDLSIEDRRIINDIVKENLETTKNSKLPFF